MEKVTFKESVRIAGKAYDKSEKPVEVSPEIAKIARKIGVIEDGKAEEGPDADKSKGNAPENK